MVVIAGSGLVMLMGVFLVVLVMRMIGTSAGGGT